MSHSIAQGTQFFGAVAEILLWPLASVHLLMSASLHLYPAQVEAVVLAWGCLF